MRKSKLLFATKNEIKNSLPFRFGNPYIYQPLNWDHPYETSILLLLSAVAIIVLHILMFCLYRLRVFLHKKVISPKVGNRIPDSSHGQDNLAFANIQSVQNDKN